MLAKKAADTREVLLQRQALGVGRNGHEVFDSPWGCFDLTVARQLAQQQGQHDKIQVKEWAEGAAKNPVCSTQPRAPGTVIVVTNDRRGLLTSLIVDGWAQVIEAHSNDEAVIDCLVLDQQATALVKLK
jgi:hypothetical protein